MSTILALRWLSLLLDGAVKSVLLLAAAGAAHLLMRRASAASRHLVWLLAIASLLALPLLSPVVPQWRARAWPRFLPLAPEPAPAARRSELRPSITRRTRPVLVRVTPLAAGASLSGDVSSRPSTLPARREHAVQWLLPLSFCLLWQAGVGVVLGQALAGMLGVWRLARRCRRVTEGPPAALAAELGRRLGLRRPAAILLAPPDAGPIVPMTWGWRRPVILLPAGSGDWSEGRLRSVLLHELAHVQRRDWPALLLTCLACALYWFHPLVWLAVRQLRIESERACDDRVLAAGVRPADYASHLLEIVHLLRGRERSLRAALTIVRSPIALRVRAILERQDRRQAPRWALLPASMAAMAILLPLAAVRPGDPSARRGSHGAIVRIARRARSSDGDLAGTPRRTALVAIMERPDLVPEPANAGKRRPAGTTRKPVRERPASPRAAGHPRPENPAAPPRRKRTLSRYRLLAAIPKTKDALGIVRPAAPAAGDQAGSAPAPSHSDGPPAGVAGSPGVEADRAWSSSARGHSSGTSPEPPALPATDPRTAPVATTVAAVDRAVPQDAAGAAPVPAAGADPGSLAPSAAFVADDRGRRAELGPRWAADWTPQTGRSLSLRTAEDRDQPAPLEQEPEPDTVLPATGQDRTALSVAPGTAAVAALSVAPREALDEYQPGASLAFGREDAGLSVSELLVWDRARRGWDRVLIVWEDAPETGAAPQAVGDEEQTWPPDSDGSPFEPGSMDEDLWFWDRDLQQTEPAPRNDEQPCERRRRCPDGIAAAV